MRLERITRINDPTAIDAGAIRAIIQAGQTATIQFSKPGYTPDLLRAVNRLCVESGERLEVRFYGHYQGAFDASALVALPEVRRLTVDSLMAITDEQQIAKLPNLSWLHFGVHNFDCPRFLEQLNMSQLTHLGLGETAKRNLDLKSLEDSNQLKSLFIQGHTKNIEVINSLPHLTELTLSSLPKQRDLHFLSTARALRSLKLILGGRTSFDEFSHPSLEELEIVWVRGLETIGSLRRFPALRSLHVEDQLKVRSVDLAGAQLRRVLLINCKNLAILDGLDGLDQLFELRVSRTNLDLDALVRRDWPASLEILAVYSGSKKWNDAARKVLDGRGFRELARRAI